MNKHQRDQLLVRVGELRRMADELEALAHAALHKATDRVQPQSEREQRAASAAKAVGRPCVIDGLEYPSVRLAARELGLPQATVARRLNSSNFAGWHYLVDDEVKA